MFNKDCMEAFKEMADNSIDALITDPPAGISFMGKEWDHDKGGREHWIGWMTEIMQECYRVLKPGAHGLVWALPRTSHWTATALENAGFEVRDVITHLFGTGFPKSLDISKAIDKAAGAERTEVIGKKHCGLHHRGSANSFTDDNWAAENRDGDFVSVTKPATPKVAEWQGWGTALKPASENWILVRKPLSEKTVAANVLKHGVGGINIDACRVEYKSDADKDSAIPQGRITTKSTKDEMACTPSQAQSASNTVELDRDKWKSQMNGRFPANLVLDEEAAALLDEQSGTLKSGALSPDNNVKPSSGWSGGSQANRVKNIFVSNSGGASRFFYVAKASKSDRGDGNNHPTVKSTKLMEYLIKLITPPNGIILDPFMGSGSTGVAAKRLGFKFIGIEKEKEYFDIAKKRIDSAGVMGERA